MTRVSVRPSTVVRGVLAAVLAVALALALHPPATWAAESDAAACPVASLPPTGLDDADGTHGDSIRCLVWYELAQGRTDASFGAHAAVRRGQMATLLLGVLEAGGAELPVVAGPVFEDAAGTTHQVAIDRLAAAGIYTGTTEGRAAPRADVTREQFAAFVRRSVAVLDGEALPTAQHGFGDVAGTHEDAVAAVAGAALMQGIDEQTFAPQQTLVRGQAATVLVGLLDRLAADGRLEVPEPPAFHWEADVLTDTVRQRMTGVTWEPGCPVGLDQLRLVELTHRGFDGRLHRGELIVHAAAVDDLEQVFSTMFEVDFPLEGVRPAHEFDGDDDAIMAANVSHAFNCRRITGGSSWSEHSQGVAIDLNPVHNPYERNGTVLPPAGASHLDRSPRVPGMVTESGPVVEAFDRFGWEWGGRWSSLVDYMHFERPR